MKINYIVICYLSASLTSVTYAQTHNIPQLLKEFSQLGIYRPQAPDQFNEQRAQEIIRIMKQISPTRAPALELAYRTSLDMRPTQAQPTRTPSPEQAQPTQPSNNAELQRIQQENQQLRTQVRQLSDENQRLRTHSPSPTQTSPPNVAELQRLQQENQLLRTQARQLSGENQRLRTHIPSPTQTSPQNVAELNRLRAENLRLTTALDEQTRRAAEQARRANEQIAHRTACQNRLEEIYTVASDLITGTNDLDIHIAEGMHELTANNDSAAAQNAFTQAHTRTGAMRDTRDRLEAIVFPTPNENITRNPHPRILSDEF